MVKLIREKQSGGAWETVVESAGGGSQPGLRTVQASFSWADVAARDPAVGVLLATIAEGEVLSLLTIYLTTLMAGTDAAGAVAAVAFPGGTVATALATTVNNSDPLSSNYGFPPDTGGVYGAFALDADHTAAADLTGGELVATMLILGGL